MLVFREFPLGRGVSELPSALPPSGAARGEVWHEGIGLGLCCSESLCLAMQPEPADGYGMMIKSLGVPLFILRRRWWHQAVNPGPLCLAELALPLLLSQGGARAAQQQPGLCFSDFFG